jgi:formylglycine-generating enzyme required for sulfatase activity
MTRFAQTCVVLLALAGCTTRTDPASNGVPDGTAAASASAAVSAAQPACGTHPEGQAWCEGAVLKTCEAGQDKTVATCWSIERCDPQSRRCEPACPEGEVYVAPPGPEGFKMGRNRIRAGEDRPHVVVLTRPFCMDETEVTAGAYEKCVQAGECQEPGFHDPWTTYKKHPDYPLNLVSWVKANNYCLKQGKSLPTEAQWDWVATGGDGREFPWGNERPTCEHMDYAPTGAPKWSPGGDWGCHGGGPSAVKSHPKGARELPDGKIYDLAGNVWEWMLDTYAKYPREKQIDPVAPDKPGAGVHTIRGGGWNRPAAGCNSWYRGGAVSTYQVPGLGFRCVRLAN